MRCPRCGNENPDTNRFCGMCGATLLSPQPAAASPTPRPHIVDRHPEPPAEDSHPQPASPPSGLGVPSFLGLNDRVPDAARNEPASSPANLALDSPPRRSGNLDYLLEDEEEPKSSGGIKFLLILAALALAVGLGYLRWKNQAFGWLSPASHKPAATAQQNNGVDANAPATSPDASTPAATPPASSTSDNTASSANQTATPTATPGATSPSSAPPSNTQSFTSPNSAPPATTPIASPAPAAKTSDQTPDHVQDQTRQDQTRQDQTKQDRQIKDQAIRDQQKPAASPAAESEPVTPVKPVDPVAEAQKYLYGRGATQNCDRGMRLLKPAANQANTKAMIELGALYSAGLCTPRDLPTAYRWFAMALRKDPSNQSVQTDLQKLWGEMTQPERQLAIRLTQ